VRETEKLVKSASDSKAQSGTSPRKGRKTPVKDADTKAIEDDLSAHLSMSVTIDHQPGAENGQITIRYDKLDQLDRLIGMLNV
jgi:ParB family chromosome partitioning protein